MKLDEAIEWLKGERSSWNSHVEGSNDRNHAFARCAEEDAAKVQEAYWIVRAHREGLTDPESAEGRG